MSEKIEMRIKWKGKYYESVQQADAVGAYACRLCVFRGAAPRKDQTSECPQDIEGTTICGQALHFKEVDPLYADLLKVKELTDDQTDT